MAFPWSWTAHYMGKNELQAWSWRKEKWLTGSASPSVTPRSHQCQKNQWRAWASSSLATAAWQGSSNDLGTWLSAVDKSGLPGKFKAWVYQHNILPRLFWLLLVYEVPITIVKGFERKISRLLHRWLGLPRILRSIALFRHNTKRPFSSLAEELKVIRVYIDSTDTKVSSAGVEVRMGWKWHAHDAVEQVEGRLQQAG